MFLLHVFTGVFSPSGDEQSILSMVFQQKVGGSGGKDKSLMPIASVRPYLYSSGLVIFPPKKNCAHRLKEAYNPLELESQLREC